MGMILRYARHGKNLLIITESNPANGALSLSLQFASFARVILVIIITNGNRRRYSPSTFSFVAIATPISTTATLVLSVKYLSRTRSRQRTQVRKCLRTCPRTDVRARESPDSSLPLTISKCSVSM